MREKVSGVLALLALGLGMVACGESAAEKAERAERERFPVDKLPGIANNYKAPKATPAASTSQDFPGHEAYNLAKQAVYVNDLESAIGHLDRAIAENPDFAEAWYQRGAAKSNRALEMLNYDEAAARDLFRDAVADKRQAGSLFDSNSFFVWTPEQQEESRSDLANGLADVDEFLWDDEKLTMAMRLYAGGMR